MQLVMAMVAWVGAGMEVLGGMHAEQSQEGLFISQEILEHFPSVCVQKTLMTPDHISFQVEISVSCLESVRGVKILAKYV